MRIVYNAIHWTGYNHFMPLSYHVTTKDNLVRLNTLIELMYTIGRLFADIATSLIMNANMLTNQYVICYSSPFLILVAVLLLFTKSQAEVEKCVCYSRDCWRVASAGP